MTAPTANVYSVFSIRVKATGWVPVTSRPRPAPTFVPSSHRTARTIGVQRGARRVDSSLQREPSRPPLAPQMICGVAEVPRRSSTRGGRRRRPTPSLATALRSPQRPALRAANNANSAAPTSATSATRRLGTRRSEDATSSRSRWRGHRLCAVWVPGAHVPLIHGDRRVHLDP